MKKLVETTNSRIYSHITEDDNWAIVSPYRSENDESTNEKLMSQFKSEVRKSGYGFIQFVSRWVEDGKAFDESSLLIPNCTKEDALKFGKEYHQSSVIVRDDNGCNEICTTNFVDGNHEYNYGDVVRTFNLSGNKVMNYEEAEAIFSKRKGGPASMPKNNTGRKNLKPFRLSEVYEVSQPRPSYFQNSVNKKLIFKKGNCINESLNNKKKLNEDADINQNTLKDELSKLADDALYRAWKSFYEEYRKKGYSLNSMEKSFIRDYVQDFPFSELEMCAFALKYHIQPKRLPFINDLVGSIQDIRDNEWNRQMREKNKDSKGMSESLSESSKDVSIDKMSKKDRKAFYDKQRNTWGRSPVTKTKPSDKIYDRKKFKKDDLNESEGEKRTIAPDKNYHVLHWTTKEDRAKDYGNLPGKDIKGMLRGYKYDDELGMWFSKTGNSGYSITEIKESLNEEDETKKEVNVEVNKESNKCPNCGRNLVKDSTGLHCPVCDKKHSDSEYNTSSKGIVTEDICDDNTFDKADFEPHNKDEFEFEHDDDIKGIEDIKL